MTIVLNEMFVIFLGREVYVHRLFIRAAGHGPELRQTIDTSVLQNYTGPRGACQPEPSPWATWSRRRPLLVPYFTHNTRLGGGALTGPPVHVYTEGGVRDEDTGYLRTGRARWPATPGRDSEGPPRRLG